ncbi:SDR family oxidoreductase [candidate division KSB1 bacterium]|nr:SDR family oxidoreductase [candidate division KSB1 bacterium]
MSDIKKKIIWVTGSGRGIGRAIALELGRRGAHVVVSSRTEEEIKTVEREAEKSESQLFARVCDVTDEKSVNDLQQAVRSHWGPIDVLVNNAGLGIFKKIMQTNLDEWERMMAVNARSAFLCTRAVLPDMIERRDGHIINVVSVAGRQPYYNCGGYCASKYAMLGFTEVLRMETRKHGIRVTAFLPGATDTAIWGSATVDRSKMMQPEQVAQSLADICCAPASAMIEEVVLRPMGGDL